MTPSPSHFTGRALNLRYILHDVGEIGGKCRRGFVPTLFGECRIPGEVEKGDRRRPLRLLRRNTALVHELFGDADDVLEQGVLPVSPLEPGDKRLQELGVVAGALVDQQVLLLIGKALSGSDLLPNRTVEELEPGANEPLNSPRVKPSETRELVVVGGSSVATMCFSISASSSRSRSSPGSGKPSSPPRRLRKSGPRPSWAATPSYVAVASTGSGRKRPSGKDNSPEATPRETSSSEIPASSNAAMRRTIWTSADAKHPLVDIPGTSGTLARRPLNEPRAVPHRWIAKACDPQVTFGVIEAARQFRRERQSR